jgi:hypothetical protein
VTVDQELQILLDDFNFYRTHTNHFQKLRQRFPGIKLSKMNKKRAALLTEMVAWCRGQNIDPRHWLYCLFARSRWLFSPKWTPGFFMSKTALAWYRDKGVQASDRLYRERVFQTRDVQRDQEGTSPVYDPVVDLSTEIEARKRRLLNHSERLCLDGIADPHRPTLGFHPKSRVCLQCPAAEECKAKLRTMYPYDVVALRDGSLTRAQANLTVATNARIS